AESGIIRVADYLFPTSATSRSAANRISYSQDCMISSRPPRSTNMTSPTQIPAAAWSRRFDAAPIPAARPSRPSLRGIVGLLPTIVRLGRQRRRLRSTGRMPVMDPFEPLAPDSVMGVPLGGLGGGSITRGWLGDFVRWQM